MIEAQRSTYTSTLRLSQGQFACVEIGRRIGTFDAFKERIVSSNVKDERAGDGFQSNRWNPIR